MSWAGNKDLHWFAYCFSLATLCNSRFTKKSTFHSVRTSKSRYYACNKYIPRQLLLLKVLPMILCFCGAIIDWNWRPCRFVENGTFGQGQQACWCGFDFMETVRDFFSFDSIHFCFVLPTGNCKASQQVLIDFLTTLYLIDSSLKIRNPASLGDFPFCGTTNDDQVFTLVILPFIIHVFIP